MLLPDKNLQDKKELSQLKTEYIASAKNEKSSSLQPISTAEQIKTDSNVTAPALYATSTAAEGTIALSAGVSLTQETNEDLAGETQSKQQWGKYEIFKEINRGGMGRIVLWKDSRLHRLVATKLLLGNQNQPGEMIQRFVEEGQITGQLEHPNIIPIYEMGTELSGNPYFTMKYVKGKSLKNLLEEILQNADARQQWSLNRMLQIFQNICHAIDYAHSKKVIHRDLKPDNVMLGSFGEVMVMDWGLAKVIGQGQEILAEDSVTTLRSEGGFKTITGRIAGTPVYMSPEQANGDIDKVDSRSDIYALGAILYEIVTGSQCVQGKTVLAIIANVTQGYLKPVPKKGLWGPVAPELRAIIQKALRHEREERYQSVRELVEDIQRLIEGREVKAYHYSALELVGRTVRHYRREIALVVVTVLALLPAFMGWEYYKTQQLYKQYTQDGNDALKLADAEIGDLGLDIDLPDIASESVSDSDAESDSRLSDKKHVLPPSPGKIEQKLLSAKEMPSAKSLKVSGRASPKMQAAMRGKSESTEQKEAQMTTVSNKDAAKRPAHTEASRGISAREMSSNRRKKADPGTFSSPVDMSNNSPISNFAGSEACKKVAPTVSSAVPTAAPSAEAKEEAMPQVSSVTKAEPKATEPETEASTEVQTEESEESAQELPRPAEPVKTADNANAKKFDRIKDQLLKSIELYKKAYKTTRRYDAKQKEAQTWLKMFAAASALQNNNWMGVAEYQINNLCAEDPELLVYQQSLQRIKAQTNKNE